MSPPAKKLKKSDNVALGVPAAKPAQSSGDALEDDFALEPSFAPSDSEGDEGQLSDGDGAFPEDTGAIPARRDVEAHSDDDDEQDSEPPAKKRKANAAGISNGAALDGNNVKKTAKEKGKQKKEKRKAKIAELGEQDDQGERLGQLPPEYLVDRLADKQKKALPKTSAIEMDDMRILGESRQLLSS